MNQLIRITDNSQGEKEVLASELHAWLGIKARLNDWMARTLRYGFEEGKDFYSILSKSTGGRRGT